MEKTMRTAKSLGQEADQNDGVRDASSLQEIVTRQDKQAALRLLQEMLVNWKLQIILGEVPNTSVSVSKDLAMRILAGEVRNVDS